MHTNVLRPDDDHDDFDGHGQRPRRSRSEPPHPPSRLALFLLLAVGLLGLGVTAAWFGNRILVALRPQPAAVNPDAQPHPAAPNGPLDADETEANQVFEAVKASVVNVDTVLLRRAAFEISETHTGTGSGFVWDAEGRVVTNFHVIADTYKRANMAVRVVMSDRKEYNARIVGTAADYDLAVVQILKVPKEKLKPIEAATSSDLKVGQKVFAIGNPFGLSGTLTEGIISNLDRTIEAPTGAPITGAIQHTAQINPGNSGGPLLNRHGKLVGVNASIATPSGGNVGIGFAIPSDTVNKVVTAIIRQERPKKPDLGISLFDEKKLRAAGYDRGVMIKDVVPGGPADKANLHGLSYTPRGRIAGPGDVILAINGEEIQGIRSYQRIVARLKPGQTVKVKYMRDEVEQETEITARGV